MTDERTAQKRARYLRLIALRDRVDRAAKRAAKRIHSHEGLTEFWLHVQTTTEEVAAWPKWKRDINKAVMEES